MIESSDITILFNGNIDSDGSVNIPIKKLKDVLEEGISGTLKLEVIADGDSYFIPWSDEFETKLSKKVTVEVTSKNHKKTISENIFDKKPKVEDLKISVVEEKNPKIKIEVL